MLNINNKETGSSIHSRISDVELRLTGYNVIMFRIEQEEGEGEYIKESIQA